MKALVTGATGFVGGGLARLLAERGHEVRGLVRDRGRASDLETEGFELHEGDVLDPDSLRGAGRGADVAYYLVHSMGRGGGLARVLAERGHEVRGLVRDRGRASDLEAEGFELHEGDVLDPDSLRGAGRGADVGYYLVHSMGRGGGDDFAERERRAAAAFARMAAAEGVGRVIYLGGLGEPRSEHLRSRAETATTLAAEGPPLTYVRAAMVIGARSESYRTLRYLVERLPAMIAPAWLRNRTQPIADTDVFEYLAQAGERDDAAGREVQVGGSDVVTYAELLDLMADVLGRRRRPKLPFPLLSPRLSSHWIGLVTPVDAGVAQPLIESLASETVVTDPAPASLFDVHPIGSAEALRRAHAEEAGAHA